MYDQQFHDGVNIIRGENGHGKSTISDFLFFALGGEVSSWKPEAARCEMVLAEVEINQTVVTLRRIISDARAQEMHIFWDTIDSGLKEPFTGWEVYPYARTENKLNFSQVLFRLLQFPEVRGEHTTNLTMNQILRLVYVDQLSNVQALLREEPFDSPMKRRAIGDLLYGVYNDQLYADELRLRKVEKETERAENEYTNLRAALQETGQLTDLEAVAEAEREAIDQLNKIREYLTLSEASHTDVTLDQSSEIKVIEAQLRKAKGQFNTTAKEHQDLQFKIADSEAFIEHLTKRLCALDESVEAEKALGNLALQVCPECLQRLDDHSEEGHCILCKRSVGEYGREQKLARMRNELATQIHESNRLLEVKREESIRLNSRYNEQLNALAITQSKFDDYSTSVRSNRDAALDGLYEKKGALESQMDSLRCQRRLVEHLSNTQSRLLQFKKESVTLRYAIKNGRSRQELRRATADAAVEKYALELLKRDLPREPWFEKAQHVQVNFSGNYSAVDERDTFSASCIIYLKNSVHFAIFFASLELDFFRYPKLILNDNIEDKGMEDERSHNFQRLVIELSNRFTVRHQIIFTTSKIAPDLEGTPYCVGPAYTGTRRSLEFPEEEASSSEQPS